MPIIIEDSGSVPLVSFVREVMPHVPQCPEFSAEVQVLEAARDFCRRSRIWRQENTLLVTTVADQAEYDLDLPDAAELASLASAWVGDQEADIELPGEGDDIEPGTSGTEWKVGVVDHDTIRLTPAPDTAGIVVSGTAIFAPAEDATTVPDFLYRRWKRAIVHGAIAALQSEAGKPWSNPGAVLFHQGKFDDGILEASNKAGPVRRRPLRVRTY
jgi:hypothetical protein